MWGHVWIQSYFTQPPTHSPSLLLPASALLLCCCCCCYPAYFSSSLRASTPPCHASDVLLSRVSLRLSFSRFSTASNYNAAADPRCSRWMSMDGSVCSSGGNRLRCVLQGNWGISNMHTMSPTELWWIRLTPRESSADADCIEFGVKGLKNQVQTENTWIHTVSAAFHLQNSCEPQTREQLLPSRLRFGGSIQWIIMCSCYL